MPPYAYTPLSFNGQALTGGNLTCYFEWTNGPGQTREMGPVESDVVGRGPQDVRGQPKATTWELHVRLASFNQTDLDAFYSIFSEEAGLVYLRLTDGGGVAWRVAVRALRINLVSTGRFVVVLRVPQPLLEEDASTTMSLLNQSGNTLNFAPSVGGNRRARPLLRIVPDLVKQNTVDDYFHSFRGFLVNRAPSDFYGPVWLMDQSGAPARVNTANLVQTATSTTLNGVVGAGDTSITLTSAASFPTAGMAYITDGGTNDEQIYWTSKSGNVLQGVVRGIGGTAAVGHASGLTIKVSEALKNGDDCRVWVDDVEYERWLVGWNGASSDVVINVSMPQRVKLTLAAAITASPPAFDFTEGSALLPEKGFIVIENEVIYYAAKTALGVTGCVRGAWGTSAATHVINSAVYGNPRLYTVAVGKAAAGAPPSPAGHRPACQLPASSNQSWKWGDQADDASTVFYARTTPDRTAQWVPGFDADGNTVSPLTQLNASGNILTFKDDVPGDGSPPYNNVAIELPQGVRTGTTSAFSADWTPSPEILNLELWLRDVGGTYKLTDQLQQVAAAAGRLLPANLANNAYAAKLKARYNIATGFRGDDSVVMETILNASNANNVDGVVAFKFTLSNDTRIKKIMARMAKTTAGSQDVTCQLFTDSSGLPGTLIVSLGNQTISGTTPAFYTWQAGVFTLTKPGTYWAVFFMPSGFTSVNFYGYTSLGGVRKSSDRTADAIRTGGAWQLQTGENLWAYVCCDYEREGNARVEYDQPVVAPATDARTGVTASFDKVSMLFSLSDHPFVHRTGGFTNGLYHCAGTWSSSTTGDSIAIDKWMAAGSQIEIECRDRTVIYTEGAVDYPVTKAIDPANAADWLLLLPGANTLTYSEPNMRQTDAYVIWQGQKV